GAFTFFDAQMDDHALGLWAAERAVAAGVTMKTVTEVYAITPDATINSKGGATQYDLLVNVAGPWAADLLLRSGIKMSHTLDLVRGSHLILAVPAEHAFLVEAPDDERLCFILPYQGRTLLGTTEVRQT